jgi:hypothetical protein
MIKTLIIIGAILMIAPCLILLYNYLDIYRFSFLLGAIMLTGGSITYLIELENDTFK